MEQFADLIATLRAIHALAPLVNRDLLRFLAVWEIHEGRSPQDVAQTYGFSRPHLVRKLDDLRNAGLTALVPDLEAQTTEQRLARRRKGIAQMLLGTLAERQFLNLAREITGGRAFQIEDHRPSRTDTDYRLSNGHNNPLLRMNIKFHGTLFRQARDQVGLEPMDCVALATYKIHNALQRQQQEALPYVFFVLSVPGLTADRAAQRIPDEYVWTVCACRGRREIEEGIVLLLLSNPRQNEFEDFLQQMTAVQFRVISAQRAYNLMRDHLFERVFALRQRAFTVTFRNAEIDMHLSLSQEMTPIKNFFNSLATLSPQELAVRLYRGDM